MVTSETSVRKLRIGLAQITPLLADLMRRAVEGRGDFEVFEVDARSPPAATPTVVILGPRAKADMERVMKQRFPDARILALASDLSHLCDRETGVEHDLTLENLIGLLRT